MRLLVTGAKGQVGSEFVETVAQKESSWEVLATDKDELDFTNRVEVFGAIDSFLPDIIVHCGALTAVDLCEDEVELAYSINAMGTRFLKQGARRVGASVFYLSTDYVFNGLGTTPYREWDAPDPLSIYGKSKLAGELELDSSDLIVRTAWVMGKYGNNILKTMIRLAKGQGDVTFVDDQFGIPTVVTDLVDVMIKLISDRQSGIYHVTNCEVTSWHDLTKFVFETLGANPSRVLPIATSQLDSSRKAPRPAYSVLDHSALRLGGYGETPIWQESVSCLIAQLRDSYL
ncbi:unnamed protein product [Acidithrix sp. C25]|nr:unnamed protein product [Acidithrix sp. C25]